MVKLTTNRKEWCDAKEPSDGPGACALGVASLTTGVALWSRPSLQPTTAAAENQSSAHCTDHVHLFTRAWATSSAEGVVEGNTPPRPHLPRPQHQRLIKKLVLQVPWTAAESSVSAMNSEYLDAGLKGSDERCVKAISGA